MHHSRRRRLAQAVAVLSLAWAGFGLTASEVHAQAWLEDRERTEGPGIRLGDLELHPGIGAEIGYDSNVFYSDSNEQSSAILRVTPHLMLSTLGPQRRGEGEREGNPPSVEFRGGLSASLYHYFATSAKTNVGGDLDLRLIIMPERPFQLTLFENFGRTIRPFTEAGAIDANYGRINNNAGIRADFGTRGQIFKGWLGYAFGVDLYEGASFDFANALDHHITAGTAWKFFPNTAFLYDFDLHFTNYPNEDTTPGRPLLTDQIRLRSRVGLNGAFTTTFSALAMVGYAAGFYSEGSEYDDIVGQLELRFQFTPTSRFALGYDRDFQRSAIGSFYRHDRGYANLQVLFGSVFLLGVEGGVGLYDFGAVAAEDLMPLGTAGYDRSDVRANVKLFAEYRVADWLGFNATGEYTGDFTDFQYDRIVGMTTTIDPAEYSKFEAWFGVRAFY